VECKFIPATTLSCLVSGLATTRRRPSAQDDRFFKDISGALSMPLFPVTLLSDRRAGTMCVEGSTERDSLAGNWQVKETGTSPDHVIGVRHELPFSIHPS
jgi:hypothetical protein